MGRRMRIGNKWRMARLPFCQLLAGSSANFEFKPIVAIASVDMTEQLERGDGRHDAQEDRLLHGGRIGPGVPKDRERDPHRLSQRQKQIDFGKNTAGYREYIRRVPKQERKKHHPRTPDIHAPCSKRQWAGRVRKWRRMLHDWDPPKVKARASKHADSSAARAIDPNKVGRDIVRSDAWADGSAEATVAGGLAEEEDAAKEEDGEEDEEPVFFGVEDSVPMDAEMDGRKEQGETAVGSGKEEGGGEGESEWEINFESLPPLKHGRSIHDVDSEDEFL